MDKNLLILAAVNSDLDSIKSLIRDGVDVNYVDKFGATCLTTACHYDNDEIVSYLIQSGVNLNQKNDKDDTAIHRCVKKRSFKCLKLLLDNGAQVDVRSNGMTPLLLACDMKRAEVMEYFFGLPSCTRASKIEALEFIGAKCVKEGDFESAREYWSRSLEERAKAEPGDAIHPKSNEKHPVYGDSKEFVTEEELDELASSEEDMWMQALIIMERILGSNNLDVYYEFIEQACEHFGYEDYATCLPLWMYMLDVELKSPGLLHRTTSNTLLSLNNMVSAMSSENPPAPYKDVMTVLNKVVFMSELIMKHHMPNEPHSDDYHMENVILLALNSIGFLAKHQSQMSEKDQIDFRDVVKKFVNLRPLDVKQRTPLHLVFRLSEGSPFSFEAVQLLLEAGADPRAIDDNTNTPLHIACMQSQPRHCMHAIKLLLKSGANPGASDCDGNTPLHMTCTQREISNSNLEVAKWLLEAGVDTGAVDQEGKTPLHLVCMHRKSSKSTLDLIELLLKARGNAGAVDSLGNTPLHLACDNDNSSFSILEVVRMLLDAGAKPTVVNKDGKTALQLVSNNDHPAKSSVIELLQQSPK